MRRDLLEMLAEVHRGDIREMYVAGVLVLGARDQIRCCARAARERAASDDARGHLLELLRDVLRRAVKLLRDRALLLRGEPVVDRTKIAVDHALAREVGRAEDELILAREGRRLLPQVHLERLAQLEVVL